MVETEAAHRLESLLYAGSFNFNTPLGTFEIDIVNMGFCAGQVATHNSSMLGVLVFRSFYRYLGSLSMQPICTPMKEELVNSRD